MLPHSWSAFICAASSRRLIQIAFLAEGLHVAIALERFGGGHSERPHDKLGFDKVSEIAGAGDWLEQWLNSLEVDIPSISKKGDGVQVDITEGSCRHFNVATIESSPHDTYGASIKARGIGASCGLHWSLRSLLIPGIPIRFSEGHVDASVSNSTLGGTFALVPDRGVPTLPSALQASGCNAHIQVSDIEFSGSLQAWVIQHVPFLRTFIMWLLTKDLGDEICKQLNAAIDTQVSEAIANASRGVRDFMNTSSRVPSKPGSLPEPHSDFIDFAGNPATGLLQQLLDRVFTNPDSSYSLNNLVRMVSQNGTLFTGSNGTLLPADFLVHLGNLGVVNITLAAISLNGLDTLSLLKLRTLAPQQLALDLGFRNFSVDATIHLEVTPSGPGFGPVHGDKLIENFNISVGLHDFSTHGAFFLAVNQSEVGKLAIDQLPNAGCLGPAVHSAMMTQASAALPVLWTSLTPLNGSTLEHGVDALINLVVGLVLKQFSASMSNVSNHTVAVLLKDKLNNATRHALASASHAVCPAPQSRYTSEPLQFFTRIGALALGFLGLLTFPICAFTSKYKKHDERSRPVLETSQSEVSCCEDPQEGSEGGSFTNHADLLSSLRNRFPHPGQPGAGRCCNWDCLAFHPRVFAGFRWGLPCLAVATICLFILSNAGIGTSVQANVLANGKPIAHLPAVFEFSLVSSVKDMWDSKAYLLAVCIVIFSGVWPYIKLVMMLFCWFMPTSKLSAKLRQSLLEFLDEWGKWSLMDAFVMVLFMVGFKFDVSAPESRFPWLNEIFDEAGGTVAIHVFIRADTGFYTFVTATLSSLVVGMLMTANHRYALQIGEYSPLSLDLQSPTHRRLRLCNKLRPPGRAAGKFFVYGPVAALGISMILVLVGLWVDSFQFTFEGLASYIIGPEKSVRPCSVMGLGIAVPNSGNGDNFATRSLQLVFLIFAGFAVLIYQSILLVLWCAPLSHRMQTYTFVAAQVLSAWSGLDVFILAIFACITQVELMAKQIIGHKCDSINPLLEKMPFADQIPGPKTCFDLVSELQAGFWILFPAAVLSSITGCLMLSRCKKALCSVDAGN